jgi:hypothetical protein
VSGEVVTVTGSGFSPSAFVILSDCITGATLGYCGGSPRDHVEADASGNFTYEFRVARGTFDESVQPPVLVDCARAPETCSLLAYNGLPVERASAPISFDAGAPPPSAVAAVTPAGPLHDDQVLTVDGSGFIPHSTVFVGQCAPTLRADFLGSPCAFPAGALTTDAQGDVSTSVTVASFFFSTDCTTPPGRCFVRVTSMDEPLETVDTPLVFTPLPLGPTPPDAPTPVEALPGFTG